MDSLTLQRSGALVISDLPRERKKTMFLWIQYGSKQIFRVKLGMPELYFKLMKSKYEEFLSYCQKNKTGSYATSNYINGNKVKLHAGN